MKPASADLQRQRGAVHLVLLASLSLWIVLSMIVAHAGLALATERTSPVKLTVELPSQAVAEGAPFPLNVELRGAGAALLTDLRLEGRGWTTREVSAPTTLSLSKDDSERLRFEVTAANLGEPLRLHYVVNGTAHDAEIDLSGANSASSVGRLVSVSAEPPAMAAQSFGEFQKPQPKLPTGPVLGKESNASVPDTDTLGPTMAKYSITVQGRVVVTRDDGMSIGVDGATVSVLDEDWSWDEHLAAGVTDVNGSFSITFNWSPCGVCDSTPDLYVRVEASNSETQVQSTWFELNYAWAGRTYDDYSGSNLNVGTVRPESNRAALQILTSITRGWRFILDNRGYDLPPVDVQWPETSGASYYDPFWEEIHLRDNRSWSEPVQLHEYGHHVMNKMANSIDTDYCNSMCDSNPPDDCTHCEWCPEDTYIAWKEGFSNWLGDAVTRFWKDYYPKPPRRYDRKESIHDCFKTGTYGNPEVTESFLAALLVDIEDSHNEEDDYSPGYFDALSLGYDEILAVVDLDEPIHPMAFLNAFRNRYPQHTEELWETAMNNGFDIDADNPNTSPVFSARHDIGVASPDATVRFEWPRAIDLTSGIAGYSYLLTSTGPSAPNTSTNVDASVLVYESNALAPGSYWFNLRAVDRAGRWDPGYETYGPVVIREPLPADLAMLKPSGWDFPVVPRGSSDATLFNVEAPTSVLSNTSTWWNAGVINHGESPTSSGFSTYVRVDGVTADSWGFGVPLEAYTSSAQINRGPLSIPGGRHSFDAFVDGAEYIAEPIESDNMYGRQWIWNPTVFWFNMAYNNPTPPPLRTGGWEAVSGVKWYNCHGYRLITSPAMPSPFSGVYVVADMGPDDYDLRLHDVATSATSGFGSNLGWSARPSGCTDAVLVNSINRPADYYDIGVLNILDDLTDGYYIEARYAGLLTPDVPVNASLTSGDGMALYRFDIAAVEQGPYSVYVDASTLPGDGPLQLAWYDASFSTGDLTSYGAVDTTDASGWLRLDIANAGTGTHGLALWRDHKDGPLLNRDYAITLRQTPPDLAPHVPTSWANSVVPRATGDADAAWAPASPLLPGDSAATYLNTCVRNDGVTAAGSFSTAVHLDGVLFHLLTPPSLSAGASRFLINSSGYTVRGGRHTLTLSADHYDTQAEINEENNTAGLQWVWEPISMAMDLRVVRSEPPVPTGGWDRVVTPDELFYNCDGLRTPTFTASSDLGYWGGVAALPGAFSDVDLRLHSESTGSTDGFAEHLAWSSWPTGQSDFVIANFNRVADRRFDVGVLQGINTKLENYDVVATESTLLASDPSGLYTGFTLYENEILRLHEVEFTVPDRYTITLNPRDGDVDLGFSLYAKDGEYFAKEDVFAGSAISWQDIAGEVEEFTANIVTPGYYCLAVWRVGRSDMAYLESYELNFSRESAIGVEAPTIPRLTQISGVHPNPFNPRTTITFDLANAGRADLRVFDVQGRLVTSLLGESLPAGRHEALWDGRDDGGRSVASGSYFVRLAADGKVDRSKMMLLK